MANLNGFGVGNFKAIKDFQWIELAPITVLVGPNGSGKSSLVQALLMFDETIHSHKQYWKYIVHKKPLEDTVSYDVEYFDGFSIDQFSSFDNLFFEKFVLSKESFKQFTNFSNDENIVFRSNYFFDIELVYDNRTLRELKIRGKNTEVYSYFNLDSKEIIINWLNIKEYLIKQIDNAIWMQGSDEYFQPAETSRIFSSLLWAKITDAKGNFSIDFHTFNQEEIKKFAEVFSTVYDDAEIKGLDTWESIGNLFNSLFAALAERNEWKVFFDSYSVFLSEVFYSYIDSREYTYHPCTLQKLDKIIKRNSDSKFNDLIFKFAKDNLKNGYNDGYLKKWMTEFGIADDYEIKILYESYVEFWLLKGDKRINISDIGFGNMQIIKLLLEIRYEYSNVIIEEPETNLHPKYQSKLADLFVDAIKNHRAKFIIETHSEYLVRKLQFLTAKNDIQPKDTVIYYFHHPEEIPNGEKQIKKLTIRDDGMMDDDFGTGFFDESARLTLDLLGIQSQN